MHKGPFPECRAPQDQQQQSSPQEWSRPEAGGIIPSLPEAGLIPSPQTPRQQQEAQQQQGQQGWQQQEWQQQDQQSQVQEWLVQAM